MRIIFWGTPKYSTNTLQALINSNHELLAVVTQPDKKRSRGSKLEPSPVKELADHHRIPTICPHKIKGNNDLVEILREKECDVFIVIAYGKILTKELLDIPKYGSWNAHASLLPRWRGAAPVHWSLLSGDKFTGVGIMEMEEGLDTGNILIEKKIPIAQNDNLITLSNKLSKLSEELVIESLDILERNLLGKRIETTSQLAMKREIKYARMINKSDYLINLNDTALEITRKINGLYPRAYINFNNKNMKILSAKILSIYELTNKFDIKIKRLNSDPGEIIGIIKDLGFILTTKTDPILILDIKLEGKKSSSKTQLIQQLKPQLNQNVS